MYPPAESWYMGILGLLISIIISAFPVIIPVICSLRTTARLYKIIIKTETVHNQFPNGKIAALCKRAICHVFFQFISLV